MGTDLILAIIGIVLFIIFLTWLFINWAFSPEGIHIKELFKNELKNKLHENKN